MSDVVGCSSNWNKCAIVVRDVQRLAMLVGDWISVFDGVVCVLMWLYVCVL